MNKQYEWLLFDADHTLFDFDEAEVQALAASYAEYGYPFAADTGAVYRQINKEVWQALEQGELDISALRTLRFERLFAETGVTGDTEAFGQTYLNYLATRGDLIEGADAIIAHLSQSYRLALITNGISAVQRPRLAASQMERYFQTITISDEVGYAKPDGRIFDVAFSGMDQPQKDDVLLIGDSLTSDMQGGHNYGIDTCWYNPHGQPTATALNITYEIGSLPELLTLLGTEL